MNEYNTYLQLDTKQFAGEWIAIVDDKVVAHNKDPRIAYSEAQKRAKNKIPMLAKIPGNELLIV